MYALSGGESKTGHIPKGGIFDVPSSDTPTLKTHQYHPKADLPRHQPVLSLACCLTFADSHDHRRQTVGHGATQSHHNVPTPYEARLMERYGTQSRHTHTSTQHNTTPKTSENFTFETAAGFE